MTPKCPNCQASLTPSDALCPTCRIDLRTPEAAELFQLDAYFAGGLLRRQQLLDVLFARRDLADQPQSPSPPMPPHGWVPQAPPPPATLPRWPAPPDWPGERPVPRARPRISAQHVLLAIGALLVVSASAVFIAAIWGTIGLTGQAIVMLALTAFAGGATALSARRSLAATAEAFAMITLGLTVIDLVAVRHYNLANAASMTASWYFGLSLAVLGAVSLALHRTASGLRVTLPAASVSLAWSVWAPLLQYGNSDATRIALLALAIALVDLGLAVVFTKASPDAVFPSSRRIASLVTQAVTILACIVQVIASLTTFLSLDGPGPRYGVWAAMFAVPLVLLLVGRVAPVPSFARWSARIWMGSLIVLPLADLPPAGYVAVAAALLGANIVLVRRGQHSPLIHAAFAAAAVLVATVAAILAADSTDTVRHDLHALQSSAQPALATAVISIAIIHTLAILVLRLAENDAIGWTVGTALPFGLLILNLAHAHGLAGTAVAATIAAITYVAIVSLHLRRHREQPPASAEYEVLTLGLGTAFLLIALAAAFAAGPSWAAAVCYAVGITIVAYATSPGRMRAAYVGSAAISAGTATLTHAHHVSVIEVVTVPAAAMLALIAWLEWRRNPHAPTFLTVGPWLSVLLLPTTWQALGDGQTWRAATVVVLAAIAVIMGFARNGRAPVTIGGFGLIVMAVTQGGPYLAYVPSWVLLYGGGAALLACGILWERAISLGRRTARYLAQMH